MNIYCGNNQLEQKLINGQLRLGTRYTCLKKGIGVGLNLPYDEKYQGDYQAIDDTKIYCGNQNNVPDGYDRFGNIAQCLQKGVALGKRQKALLGPPTFFRKYIKYIILIIIYFIIFILLYYLKPYFIVEIDKNNNKKIILEKFILYYIIFCVIIFLIFNFIV
jgi:hypothetical protein